MTDTGTATSAELAIEAIGVEKSFGVLNVLNEIDLRVEPGSVCALLGPNGAGKTTTVRILATLSRADAGRVRIAGWDVVRDRRRVRRAISLTGQFASLDQLQTGEENLRMIGRLWGLRRADALERARTLLDRFGLSEHGRRRVVTYSGGMRRRLDLAASLVGRPEVVFLDEPTTGLDVHSRRAMWDAITDLARAGATVFLTTQYLEEADRLADHVALLDHGRIVAEGTPAELKRRVGGQRLDLTFADRRLFDRAGRILGRRAIRSDPDGLTIGVSTDGSGPHMRSLLDEIDPARIDVVSFSVHRVSLDDVFLALTAGGSGGSSTEAVRV